MWSVLLEETSKQSKRRLGCLCVLCASGFNCRTLCNSTALGQLTPDLALQTQRQSSGGVGTSAPKPAKSPSWGLQGGGSL